MALSRSKLTHSRDRSNSVTARDAESSPAARSWPASAPAAEHFRFVAGQDRIETFEAPILRSPPAYLTCFCQVCGSPTPAPHVDGEFVEIPAGMQNDDPGLRPDKHILTEHRAGWHVIDDDLPQFDREGIDAHRARQKDP